MIAFERDEKHVVMFFYQTFLFKVQAFCSDFCCTATQRHERRQRLKIRSESSAPNRSRAQLSGYIRTHRQAVVSAAIAAAERILKGDRAAGLRHSRYHYCTRLIIRLIIYLKGSFREVDICLAFSEPLALLNSIRDLKNAICIVYH